MSEFPRDMGRAHWQRSEAMVLYSVLADVLYQDSEAILPDRDIATILDDRSPDENFDLALRMGMTPLQRQGYRLGQCIFMGTGLERLEGMSRPPLTVRRNIAKYTYEETALNTVREASRTMACFPLNVAFTASAVALEQDIDDYKVDSLDDLSSVLRRGDIRAIIDQGAFTANTVWGSLSADPHPDLRRTISAKGALEYDFETSTMRLDPLLSEKLRHRLSRNNKLGVSNDNLPLEQRVSSGCPARHIRPHFTNSETDKDSIKKLARYFGMSVQQLLAPRERTGIEVGLDFMCDTLDRASAVQSRLAAIAVAAS